ITLIEGSSVAESTVEQLTAATRTAARVLVALDSNHSRAHVLKEMELYSSFVSIGSYLVVMDGAQAHVSDIPRGKPEWKEDNPLAALEIFSKTHPEFEVDPYYTR